MGIFGKKDLKRGSELERATESNLGPPTVIEHKSSTEKLIVKEKELSIIPITPKASEDVSPNLEIGKMKVIIRIRPFSETEKQILANSTTTIQANNDRQTLQIYNPDGKVTVMGFDKVYDSTINQNTLFTESGVCNQILQALSGYVTTIFAFGQTGSGKTFSIYSTNLAITGPSEIKPDPETVGLVPRGLAFMFEQLKIQKDKEVFKSIRVQASYLEIYNETVLDLLNPQDNGLPVRWSQERGFFVEHLYIVDCDSLDDCLAVLEEGLRNRTTGAQASNEHSSRSHSVLTIYLEIKDYKFEGETQNRYGKISFVDLAGSEKVKESKATFDTFVEALSINKSLLTLGKCISALADPKTRRGHIPFRDSKLTKLLADSLGGQGSALMIACISPSSTNINETFKTLRYAIQAKKIQNRPMIQLDPHEEKILNLKSEIMGLRKENAKLKELLINDGNHVEELKRILEESEHYIKNLKNRASSPINRASSRGGSNYFKAPSRASTHARLNERNNSIPRNDRNTSLKLPEIKNTTNGLTNHKPKDQVVSLPRFDTSAKTRRPNLIASQRRKSAKSAATYRVDELKRSDAPASHSVQPNAKQNILEGPISDNIQLNGTKKSQEAVRKHKSGERKPSSMKKKDPQENKGEQKSNGTNDESTKTKIKKRPSAIESKPDIVEEPFPEPHKDMKSPDPQEVVSNRKNIQKDVLKIDEEILKMKGSKKQRA